MKDIRYVGFRLIVSLLNVPRHLNLNAVRLQSRSEKNEVSAQLNRSISTFGWLNVGDIRNGVRKVSEAIVRDVASMVSPSRTSRYEMSLDRSLPTEAGLSTVRPTATSGLHWDIPSEEKADSVCSEDTVSLNEIAKATRPLVAPTRCEENVPVYGHDPLNTHYKKIDRTDLVEIAGEARRLLQDIKDLEHDVPSILPVAKANDL